MPPCNQSIRIIPAPTNNMMEHEMTDVSSHNIVQGKFDEGTKGILTPNETDVLCGRGGTINTHPGNATFRKLVETSKRIYLTARFKREKRLIAEGILNDIKGQNPPGRFLLKKDDTWYEIPSEKARDKTSQALREGAPKLREEIQNELDAQRVEQKSAPHHDYNPGYDARQNDNYYGRESQHGYGSPEPHQSQSHRFDYNNIMNTMANAFGCPGNLSDVRDDDRMHGNYPPQHEHHHHTYNNGGNSEDQKGSNGWDQSEYYDHKAPQEYNHGRSNQGYYDPDPAVTHGHHLKRQPYHNNHQGSPNDVSSFGTDSERNQKRFRTSSPVDSSMDCQPTRQHEGGRSDLDVRTPPPDEDGHPNPNMCSATFCQTNLFDIASWTIYGDQPTNHIDKVNSIEIDEPVSQSDLKGSSLVNVFNDSTSSIMEPLPVPEVGTGKSGSMMSLTDSVLNDSALNLLHTASLEMNFST